MSATTNPGFRTAPERLFDPVRNIRIGIGMLRAWKRYHARRCGTDPGHYWWAHYNQGGKVRNRRYGRKVHKHLRNLKARFHNPGEV